MTDALIYYGFTPHKRRWECQPSVESMELLVDAGYPVVYHPCREATDYADGLRKVWHHDGPLVIIEHDMVVPVSRLRELLACSSPLCAHTYWIALGVAGRRPMLSACINPLGPHGNARVAIGDSVAWYAGIGCCKLTLKTRQAMGLPGLVTWTDLEVEVNRATTVSGPWHLHWPVLEHHHGFMEAPNVRRNNQAQPANGFTLVRPSPELVTAGKPSRRSRASVAHRGNG